MKAAGKIAILGAPASGKSWLAAKLAAALADHDIIELALPLVDIAGFDGVLLMGLDLNSTELSMPVARRQERLAQDQQLRDQLARSGQSFHVIYGQGDARLQHAISAITLQPAMHSIASHAIDTRPGGQFSLNNSENWRWPCEKCSDPECEHQLFSRLLQTAGRSL